MATVSETTVVYLYFHLSHILELFLLFFYIILSCEIIFTLYFNYFCDSLSYQL